MQLRIALWRQLFSLLLLRNDICFNDFACFIELLLLHILKHKGFKSSKVRRWKSSSASFTFSIFPSWRRPKRWKNSWPNFAANGKRTNWKKNPNHKICLIRIFVYFPLLSLTRTHLHIFSIFYLRPEKAPAQMVRQRWKHKNIEFFSLVLFCFAIFNN